jgi:anti-anti-sigma factor
MNPDQASFERCERNGHSTLVVTGEIDLVTAPTFLQELVAAAGDAHSPALVDLSAVTFIDSSGLNALIAARDILEGTDVSLVLLNPSSICRRVLEVTGIDQVFEVVDCAPRA